MKRILSMLLAVLIVLSVCGCKNKKELPEIENLMELLPEGRVLAPEFVLSDEKLFLFYYDNDESGVFVCIYDLDSRETENIEVGDEFDFVVSAEVLEDGSALIAAQTDDAACGILRISENGKVENIAYIDDWQYTEITVDKVKNELWYYNYSGDACKINLNTGETTMEDNEALRRNTIISANNGKLVVRTDEESYILDTSNGEITDISWFDDSGIYLSDDCGFWETSPLIRDICVFEKLGYFDYEQPDRLYCIQYTEKYIDFCKNHVFTWKEEDGIRKFSAIDMISGDILASCSMETAGEEGMFMDCADNGKEAVISGYFNGENVIYLWRYGQNNTTGGAVNTEIITPENAEEKITELEQLIYDCSWIECHALPNTQIPDGSAYEFDTGYTSLSAYLTLCDVWSLISECFPYEVTYNSRIELYFTSEFIPVGYDTISNASGLAFDTDSSQIIVLATGNGESFSHELMHTMEDMISDYAMAQTEWHDYIGYWNDLQPDGFEYYWLYNYFDENQYMWVYAFDDIEDKWFIDSYSKVSPLEDRARVFENMLYGDSEITDAPRIKEKAVYLCSLIREVFGLTEPALWERNLGEIPPLESYDEAVKLYGDSVVGVG